MKIARLLTFRHKETGDVANFAWFETTLVKGVPCVRCVRLDEIPEKPSEMGDFLLPTDIDVSFDDVGNADLYDCFMKDEYRSGKWILVEKPVPADIPLPDPSEAPSRPSRSLLDSASEALKRK